ncbi:MAG TPA: hypothetical protein VFR55_07185 [Dehalococcoidia bacterium]|nr:hypothetical protein [Dehalococcoidia bacterium]
MAIAGYRQVLFIVSVVALALMLGLVMSATDYNVRGVTLVLLFLIILVIFVVGPRMASGEGRYFLYLFFLAFLLKMGASTFRMVWALEVKEGRIDAGRYDQTGRLLAERFWQWDFNAFVPFFIRGTHFVEAITGLVYAFIGPTLYGGFFFFAFLAFLGSCFYYKAFRLTFPNSTGSLYLAMIFFYPSWLYWPSSIGKDASLAFLIGLSAYGFAQWLRPGEAVPIYHRIISIFMVASGLYGTYMIRPHVAAFLAISMGVALVFQRHRMGAFTPIVKIFIVAAVPLVGWFIISQAGSFVGAEQLDLSGGIEAYQDIQRRAGDGGSAFDPVSITDPLGVPMAIVTILYRPFPWEAHRGAALVLALEGFVLLCLTMWRFRNILAALRAAWSNPYLMFIFVYSLVCILAFTSFGNFSIVGRQRLQFLPLFFMLLAYPLSQVKEKLVQKRAAVATRVRQERMLAERMQLVSPATNKRE